MILTPLRMIRFDEPAFTFNRKKAGRHLVANWNTYIPKQNNCIPDRKVVKQPFPTSETPPFNAKSPVRYEGFCSGEENAINVMLKGVWFSE
jgi:hypothetical protein